MAIVTKTEVKTSLGIIVSTKDAQITALIAHCFDYAKTHCNNDFSTYNDGLNLVIIKMIGHLLQNPNSLSSERLGDYGFVVATTDWPKAILRSLTRFHKVAFA